VKLLFSCLDAPISSRWLRGLGAIALALVLWLDPGGFEQGVWRFGQAEVCHRFAQAVSAAHLPGPAMSVEPGPAGTCRVVSTTVSTEQQP
jgi:hypothetical protein